MVKEISLMGPNSDSSLKFNLEPSLIRFFVCWKFNYFETFNLKVFMKSHMNTFLNPKYLKNRSSHEIKKKVI